MFNMFRDRQSSFPEFVDQLKVGTDNPLIALGVDEGTLIEAPYSMILDNPDDIASGVNRVKIKLDLSFFKMFESLLVKYYDDGRMTYLLYTTTINHKSVNEFANTLFEKLGLGVYDSDHNFTFRESHRAKDLATNNQQEKRSIMNCWLIDKYSICLSYSVNPLHQFLLTVTKTVERPIDRTTRRGTILDLVSLDLNKILDGKEIGKEIQPQENGDINCIDYKFKLDKTVLGVFDIIVIRLFSTERLYQRLTQTHVSLTSSVQRELPKLVKVCQDVMKIYGSDWNGNHDLDISDVEMIESSQYWTGRRWQLNEVNGLRTPNDDSTDVYWIELTVTEDEGFKLFIGCYNQLEEYFSAD